MERRRPVDRLSREGVGRLIEAADRRASGYGLMVRILCYTGARVSEAVNLPHLDPILKGTIKPHVVRESWDDVVRVMASIKTGTATASLILHRLGSWARQNRTHQALAEIGRVEKTMRHLRTVDSEASRRAQTRELNKGEAANDLSRVLLLGQEGALRGREFGDRAQCFSALAVLHNAVVAWNILTVEEVVTQ